MIDITKLKSDAQQAFDLDQELQIKWASAARHSSSHSWDRHIRNNSPSTTLALVAVVEAALERQAAIDACITAAADGEHPNRIATAHGRISTAEVALREALKPFKGEGED